MSVLIDVFYVFERKKDLTMVKDLGLSWSIQEKLGRRGGVELSDFVLIVSPLLVVDNVDGFTLSDRDAKRFLSSANSHFRLPSLALGQAWPRSARA